MKGNAFIVLCQLALTQMPSPHFRTEMRVRLGGSRVQKLNPLGICVTYQYKRFQVVSISVVEVANGGLIEYMVAYQIKNALFAQ